MSIEALRDRMAELSDLTALGAARRLGPAHDDAARGRRGPRRAARHARAAGARARHRRRGGGVARRRSRRRTWTGSTRRSCGSRGATSTARGASPASWRRRSSAPPRRARRSGRPRARRTTSRRSRPRCGATSSSRASTPPASRASRAPTTRCWPTTTTASPRPACRRSSASSRRRWRRSSPRRRGRAGPTVAPPVDAQRLAVPAVLARIGAGDDGWRIDVSAHPFSVGVGQRDSRVTTRYEEGDLLSVIAAMHEFGHALYERQIAPELARTNLGGGTSMSMHESQSKLWENHVGRHPAFAPVIAEALGGGRLRRRAGRAARVAGRRAAVADPRLRRPGQLPAAHRAALRARAGADRGRPRRGRPARGLERRDAAAARRRGPRRRRPASCRTPTGRPAPSATSRATRSGA